MDIDTLNKVGEIVKNINVGFDGKLNSETATQITATITEYLWMVQLKSLAVNVVWCVAIVFSSWLVSKTLLKTEG